tara:strand:- start:281 stop:502 length:222 start_codon:yes stop_codon:yes gene_type:complete
MNKEKIIKFEAELVSGKCPTCNTLTTLVGLSHDFFRCMNCGSDLEQHVNGKISYLPIMTKRQDGGIPYVKEWK